MANSVATILLAMTLLALPSHRVSAEELLVQPVVVPVLKSVFAQVQSRDLVAARARIGGTLVEIDLEAGDRVEAGDIVARVVDEKLVLQLDALKAGQKALSAQRDNAVTNLDRAKQLFSRGTISKSRLDELQTQVDVLTNELQAIEAKKAVIVQQTAEGEVVAPSSGRVLSVPVTQGSVILPGEPVARIAGGGYFLRLSLPERHAAGIRDGETVVVGGRGIDPANSQSGTVTGRVAKVYPEIKNGRVVADVEVETLGDYFVGERLLVSIPVRTCSALAVPDEAIVTRHGIDYVTIRHDDVVRDVSVIPGSAVETEAGPLVEILTGLKPGDRVVLP